MAIWIHGFYYTYRYLMAKSERKIIPSFDEIVFESRNKEYGAYQLRRKYVPTLAFGLIVSVIICCLVIFIPFWRSQHPADMYIAGGSGGGGRYVNLDMDNLAPPPEQVYVPKAPPVAPPKPEIIEEAAKYAPPEIVDTLPEVYEELATYDEALAENHDSITIIDEELIYYSDGYDFGIGGGSGDGSPFLLVEVLPSFRGGDLNTFRQWVAQHTLFPQEAIEKKIQGRVLLTFIVETDGSVSNVTIVRSVAQVIDDEAVRVISSSPKWSPGRQGGKPVRVRYSMWLGFVL